MTDLTLCCWPGACSRATMIALEEAGAAYATRVVNLRAGGQHAADYLALNPKGKVPALLVGREVLTENIAILGFLADSFPGAGLLPPVSDPLPRAQALSAVAWFASTALPAGGRIMRPERVSDQPDAAGGIVAKAREEFTSTLALADRHMGGRTWWIDRWSVADAYLFYIVGLAKNRGIDPSPYAALMAHAERMAARPATQRMLAWEEKATAALAPAAPR